MPTPTPTRRQRTFWIAYDASMPPEYRFQAFASKAQALAYVKTANVERRENGDALITVEGPFVVLRRS